MSGFLYLQLDNSRQLQQQEANLNSKINKIKEETTTFDGKPLESGEIYKVELKNSQIIYGAASPINSQFFHLRFPYQYFEDDFLPFGVRAFFNKGGLYVNAQQVVRVEKLIFNDPEYSIIKNDQTDGEYEVDPLLQSGGRNIERTNQ